MNYIEASNRDIRSVCFFDNNGAFISGVSGNESTVNYGILIPSGAKTLSATIHYLNPTTKTKAEHYLSMVEGNPVALNIDDVDRLSESLNTATQKAEDALELAQGIVTEEHTNLLYSLSDTANWFIDPSTGVGRTLAQFYSYENVIIPESTEIVWPMNYISSSDRYIRSICFYASDGSFISGVSGNEGTVNSGIHVPSDAKTLSATLTYLNASTKSKAEHYLSTKQGGDIATKILDESVGVNASQIIDLKLPNAAQIVQLPDRRPCFCFQFDDGTDGDVNTKALFDSYGLKCCFSIIGGTSINTDRYLTYQEEGFEILSHSINSTAFSSITDLATVENYLKTSLERLTAAGFDIRGFVTPSSWLLPEQLPLVKKYYQYGFGYLSGSAQVTYHQFMGKDIRQIERWSLESHTIEETMTAIQNCITNNGFMIFYGHFYPPTSETNNMTIENMNTILTFLKGKVDTYDVRVGTARDLIGDYYFFRHGDILSMLGN